MAISEEQAGALAQAYQSGSPDVQSMVNNMGVTQADVAQYFPGFDVSGAGLSLPSSQASSAPLSQASSPVSSQSVSAPLGGSTNTSSALPSNQLSGVVLAGDSWLANNPLNNPYFQTELGGTPVTNVAVGGSTSADTLKQLNDYMAGGGSFAKGSTVVLDAGGNDLLNGIPKDQILSNLNSISSILGKQGVNVVMSGAPNVSKVSDVTGSSNLSLDPLFNQVASNNPNVSVVDAMSPLLNQKNLVDSSGFHVNNAGQMAYDTALSNAVLKSQGKNPVSFSNNDIAQFAKDNNLSLDQAVALAPTFGLTKDQVTQALAPATPYSSDKAPATASDTSQLFNQTYNALQYGNTKVSQTGTNDDGSPTYGVVDPNGKVLPATVIDVGNGIYDIQVGSAGGIIHTYTNADANGNLNPIKDYSTQVQYTGGNKGGFVNQTAAGIANLGSVAAPAAAFLSGNPEFADLASTISGTLAGANTVNSINNRNVPGAVLSALGVANALPTGTLPFDASDLKTATNVAGAANAIATKNPLALANSAMSLTDTKLPSEIGAGAKLASAYLSLQKGDGAGLINSMMGFAKSQDPKVSSAAQKVSDAVQSNDPNLVKTALNDLSNVVQSSQFDDGASLLGQDPNMVKAGLTNNPTATVSDIPIIYSAETASAKGLDLTPMIPPGARLATDAEIDAMYQQEKDSGYKYIVSPTTLDDGTQVILVPDGTNPTETNGNTETNVGSNTRSLNPSSGAQSGNTKNTSSPDGTTPNGVITDLGVIGKPDKLEPLDDEVPSITITAPSIKDDNLVPNLTKITPDAVTPVDEVPTITVTGKKIPADVTTSTKVEPPVTSVSPVTIPSTPTTTKTTSSGGAPSVNMPTNFGGHTPNPIVESLLKTYMTQQAFKDPLANLEKLVKEEQQSEQPMIDPRLAQLLQERAQPQKSSYYNYGQEPQSVEEMLALRDNAGQTYKTGGHVQPLAHLSGGALPVVNNRHDFRQGAHVAGEGDGTSDDIPAMLADGEFVWPADVVAALGNGSTKAGTDKLYEMMHEIRKRARSTGPKDLPPDALKSPLDYLKKKK